MARVWIFDFELNYEATIWVWKTSISLQFRIKNNNDLLDMRDCVLNINIQNLLGDYSLGIEVFEDWSFYFGT